MARLHPLTHDVEPLCDFTAVQWLLPQKKWPCYDVPILSNYRAQTNKESMRKQSKSNKSLEPRLQVKRNGLSAIANREDVHSTETTHCHKVQERKVQLPTTAIPPLDQITVRKALAPFSTICQNMTQLELEQCNKR